MFPPLDRLPFWVLIAAILHIFLFLSFVYASKSQPKPKASIAVAIVYEPPKIKKITPLVPKPSILVPQKELLTAQEEEDQKTKVPTPNNNIFPPKPTEMASLSPHPISSTLPEVDLDRLFIPHPLDRRDTKIPLSNIEGINPDLVEATSDTATYQQKKTSVPIPQDTTIDIDANRQKTNFSTNTLPIDSSNQPNTTQWEEWDSLLNRDEQPPLSMDHSNQVEGTSDSQIVKIASTSSKETQETKETQQDLAQIIRMRQDIQKYQGQLARLVSSNWKIPPIDQTGFLIEMTALINKDGKLISTEFIKRSGITSLDAAAERAIRSSSPFPSFPESFDSNQQFLAHFRFDASSVRFRK